MLQCQTFCQICFSHIKRSKHHRKGAKHELPELVKETMIYCQHTRDSNNIWQPTLLQVFTMYVTVEALSENRDWRLTEITIKKKIVKISEHLQNYSIFLST